jgi:hypothetical protein
MHTQQEKEMLLLFNPAARKKLEEAAKKKAAQEEEARKAAAEGPEFVSAGLSRSTGLILQPPRLLPPHKYDASL